MPKPIHKLKNDAKKVRKEILAQMLTLATSAFGLVAALAWNALIQELVSDYIKPLIGGASGIVSQAIYAILVTALAVFVTYNLSKVIKKS